MNSRSTVAFIRSPRQLLQSDTGVPHFALDPLTYRCLLSLSPAADFAEPRPPRHNSVFTIFCDFNIQCRFCYTACSVSRCETVSLIKFPIKSLMIPFELNLPVSLIYIYIYIYILYYPYSADLP